MRVNFVGNTCNNHFVIARALREQGVDAQLHYNVCEGMQVLPESEDPALAGTRPDWLHPYERKIHGVLRHYTSHQGQLHERFSDCDIVHVHGSELVAATRTGKPIVWHPYGNDIFCAPFLHYWCRDKRRFGIVPDFRNLLTPSRMRAAMREVSKIVIAWHDLNWEPGFRLLCELGLESRIVRLPLPIDPARFHPLPRDDRMRLRKTLLGETCENELVIVSVTRHHAYKANDRLYAAVAAARQRRARVRLVIAEKDARSNALGREWIRAHGVEDLVQWLPKVPRHQVFDYYQIADIVADQFAAGAFGSVSIEALACGRPLMIYLKLSAGHSRPFLPPEDLFRVMPPVINVREVGEIEEAIVSFAEAPDRLESLGCASREWIVETSRPDVVARRYRRLYEELLGEHTFEPLENVLAVE